MVIIGVERVMKSANSTGTTALHVNLQFADDIVPPVTTRQRIVVVLLVGAVALAFADASVVALALPDLYGQFDTTIVGVSWVLTTYALAVAITAVPILLFRRFVRPLSFLVTGAIVFVAASVVAGTSRSLEGLLAARSFQGIGAALLLAGSLPVLAAVVPGEGRGRRWWALAAAVGAAIGPALGGVLTDVFSWRAIFFVQAPIAAGAVFILFDPIARSGHGEVQRVGDAPAARRGAAIANVAFALVFAALVAALFLGVLLAIEVWGYSPLQSALLVSALPIGMVFGRALQSAPRRWLAVGGAFLLAAGLVALAFAPGAAPAFAAAAFAMCGAGFDLLHEVLDPAAVPPGASDVRAGATTIGARHAGLVLGLVIIAPVLSSSLTTAIEHATLGATQTMLTAELPLSEKIPVTWALRNAIEDAPRGQVPDMAAEFDQRGAEGDNAMARARDDLMDTVTDTITRSFRPAFLIAALLAALAALPALLVAGRSSTHSSHTAKQRTTAIAALSGAAVVAVLVVGYGIRVGSDSGRFAIENPCTAGPDPFPGDGLDASVQRIALSTLNGAACELGTTRERLVLSLDPKDPFDDVEWDRGTMESALRSGAHRAIDDANDRRTIPGWAAAALGFIVDRAPISWLVERLPIPGS